MSKIHTIESITQIDDKHINKFVDETHKMMTIFGKENKKLKQDKDGLLHALDHEKKYVNKLQTTLQELNQSYNIIEDKLQQSIEREEIIKKPIAGAVQSIGGYMEIYEKSMAEETPIDVKNEYLKYCSHEEDLSVYKKQIKIQCIEDKNIKVKTNKQDKKKYEDK